ncbi:relaxase/mobilization nuclease domain-containing protein [Marivita sp. S0852]|uniref:relaxase/mobilization nuclease domain-containing protein n=1 Tax=Marivita sp. S0852 TaxID=3373893 RepID=UPI003981B804
MILKAKERGNAPQLARYLMTMADNDHVELHDLRGFVADDLSGAFLEAHAVAQGTRCENYMFSISLNPPQTEQVGTDAFDIAIEKVEQALGLTGQPRAIVFHEKDGRRHAHAVWSRIDSEQMRAINLSHFKTKLRDVSRDLFIENGWELPRGLEDKRLRDPLAFTRAEWQQARRAGLDPKELKAVFQKAWEASDNREAFAQALGERGFQLAKGDRRGFVAVDYRGEVCAVSRYAGVKTKDVAAKLGDPSDLKSVDDVREELAARMTNKLEVFIKDAEREARKQVAALDFKKAELVGKQRAEREALADTQKARWQAETQARAARLPKGIKGVWHRLTGRYGKIRAQNEAEALAGVQRDRAEKDALTLRQIEDRQTLQREIEVQRQAARDELMRLRKDVARYAEMDHHEQSQTIARSNNSDHDPKSPHTPQRRMGR